MQECPSSRSATSVVAAATTGTHGGGRPSVLGVQDSMFGGGGGTCRIAPEDAAALSPTSSSLS